MVQVVVVIAGIGIGGCGLVVLLTETVPKPDLVQVEGVLDDARGGDAHAQDVLLGGQVIVRGQSVDLHQVAKHKPIISTQLNNHSDIFYFITFTNLSYHAFINKLTGRCVMLYNLRVKWHLSCS